MELRDSIHELLLRNRRSTNGYRYTVPSSDHYPYQWLWDSCFHSIVLARSEPAMARDEIKALLSKQFENGMIPHIIYWTPGILHLFRWGTDGTSSLTQPPMLAYAVWEIHRRAPDIPFLESVFPALVKYYRFLLTERDPRGHHLVGIINPDESGEDNSSRFDVALGVPDDISIKQHLLKRHELVDANRECNFDAGKCMRFHFWVKDVPFNAILVENLRILANIASLLNHTEHEQFFDHSANEISSAMRERMFKDGVFWSTSGMEYEKLDVATWAHFAPLFAGLYSKEEAERIVRTHLQNEDTFKARFGIRTVSKKEPSYRQDGFWRGPVWIAPHWFIYKGLIRYGYTEEAKWIANATVALLEKSGFREYFNPETGEGYGAREFTWGALVLDMMD